MLLIDLLHPMLLIVNDGCCEGQAALHAQMRQRDDEHALCTVGLDVANDATFIACVRDIRNGLRGLDVTGFRCRARSSISSGIKAPRR
jgi:hypothetical protein